VTKHDVFSIVAIVVGAAAILDVQAFPAKYQPWALMVSVIGLSLSKAIHQIGQ
jgi:hypothetical protein